VTGRDVRVVFTKFDGSLHWHQTMQYLGEDEHGTWLGGPPGSTAQRGSEPPVVYAEPFVQLVPAGQWWTAVFNGAPARTEIYCDIASPADWKHPGEVTMIDLDLDVVRLRADQRVLIVDQDEFAEHQVRYSYPAEVITAAEDAAAWLHDVVSAHAEPFGSAYLGWLAKVC
jgi:protein associated with RNAse G/E